MNNLKSLPLSIQTFEDLITGNAVYVDKTAYLYRLIQPVKSAYFLSRPRRFGKSLTVTTLESIFLGKKELFNGLAIAKTDYEFKLNGTADDAIEQIHNKKYMEKYRYLGMPIVPVGVSFDYTSRRITEVKMG